LHIFLKIILKNELLAKIKNKMIIDNWIKWYNNNIIFINWKYSITIYKSKKNYIFELSNISRQNDIIK
jgi:hypothetical protein